MGLLAWAESITKKLSIWDISILKTALVILGMIIGAYTATFVKEYVLYFWTVFGVLYAYLLYKVFKK
ncbi:MAG: hypothetical protein KAK00_10810 [Nanoarchaeota archaeon]|nr:hypothetical protein [Nanoarchaeota archaeon]